MKIFKFYIAALFVTLTVISCDKVIDLNLGNTSGQLVIEGNITNVRGIQTVKLSKSVAVTNSNIYPPVTGATVTISDNMGNTFNLTESPAGTYSINPLGGRAGRTYYLTVITGGVTYNATSTMPVQVLLDSIGSRPSEFSNAANRRDISISYHDPLGVANQYKFVVYDNNIQVNGVFTFDDSFTDGQIINASLLQNDSNIIVGDSAKVEMQCIDHNVYLYWYSLMQQAQQGPGGGITPANPPSNITPAALGYFSAHTSQTKRILVR